MAKRKTKKKKRTTKRTKKSNAGRPTDYKAAYCDQLVAHMAEGGSFESFAGKIDKTRQTLHNWTETHPEFFDAKQRGEVKSLLFHEQAGAALMTGTLRRVKREVYARDADGNVLYRDGRPVVSSREYAPANGDGRVWSLSMKNRFRWVEPIKLSGKIRTSGMKDPADMDDDELEEEYNRVMDESAKRK